MRDGAILGAVVLVLVIVVANFLKSNRPSAPVAPAAATEQASDPATTAKAPTAAPMAWVKDLRLAGIPMEVRGGRDPFQNLLYAQPMPEQSSAPAPSGPVLPALPPVEPIVERSVPLKWITWDMLSARMRADVGDLPVDVSKGDDAAHAKVRGTKLDLQQVFERMDTLDTPPPLALAGVIVGAGSRMAVLSVNGKTYTLYEGEVVPTLGWTLAKITSTEVILRKGNFSESLRLAGGKS